MDEGSSWLETLTSALENDPFVLPALLMTLIVPLIVFLIFGGVGLLFCYISLWLLAGQERLTLGTSEIGIEGRLLGMTLHRNRVRRGEVLRLEVMEDSTGWVVKVYCKAGSTGKEQVLRFGGNGMTEPEARWLHHRLQAALG